jgi:hypothetical protein
MFRHVRAVIAAVLFLGSAAGGISALAVRDIPSAAICGVVALIFLLLIYNETTEKPTKTQ